tara:strand:+ start:329 stop:682 length:354 start_codon:yes stop_codon:yes gene_type:complete
MNTFIINTSTSRWDFDYYLEEDCIEKGRHLEKYFTLTTFNPELKSFMDEYIDDAFMKDDYNYDHYEKYGFIHPHFELFEEYLPFHHLEEIAEKFSTEIENLETSNWIVIPKDKKEQN